MISFNELMIRTLESIEEEKTKVRWDYSGRGMYGKTCIGIESESIQLCLKDLLGYFTQIIEDEDISANESLSYFYELANFLKKAKIDSLGKNDILYWENFSSK